MSQTPEDAAVCALGEKVGRASYKVTANARFVLERRLPFIGGNSAN